MSILPSAAPELRSKHTFGSKILISWAYPALSGKTESGFDTVGRVRVRVKPGRHTELASDPSEGTLWTRRRRHLAPPPPAAGHGSRELGRDGVQGVERSRPGARADPHPGPGGRGAALVHPQSDGARPERRAHRHGRPPHQRPGGAARHPRTHGRRGRVGAGRMSVLLCDARGDAIREQHHLARRAPQACSPPTASTSPVAPRSSASGRSTGATRPCDPCSTARCRWTL
jgi:hypothetical protein